MVAILRFVRLISVNNASKELVQESNDQSRAVSEALAKETERLVECLKAIEKMAAESTSIIGKHASNVQNAIGKVVNSTVKGIIGDSGLC